MAPATPSLATPRSDRPTLGPLVGELSRQIRGRRLMPWQQAVADVALELDPDAPGEWYYKRIIVSVPRQSGKSDLLSAVNIAKMVSFSRHVSIMTAQTGLDAAKRWASLVSDLDLIDSVPETMVSVRRARGSERLTWRPTGSSVGAFAPVEHAVHGDAVDQASIDEAWRFAPELGAAIEGAVLPAMATRPLHQLWIVSTRGAQAQAGGYLDQQLELARRAVADPDSRTAAVIYSADEEAAAEDPYGDAALASHPAVGYTQTTDRLRHLGQDMPLAEWRRAVLNLPTVGERAAALDISQWLACAAQPGETVCELDGVSPWAVRLAWDISLDASSATIAAAWRADDGRIAIAVPWTGPARELPQRLTDMHRRGWWSIAHDPAGPTMSVADSLDPGITTSITPQAYTRACQWLIDAVRDGTVAHTDPAVLRQAISDGRQRQAARGAYFDAARSDGPIDALRAAAIAAHAAAADLTDSAPVY